MVSFSFFKFLFLLLLLISAFDTTKLFVYPVKAVLDIIYAPDTVIVDLLLATCHHPTARDLVQLVKRQRLALYPRSSCKKRLRI